jgi:predicted molibdopterin-dependent oxidoreductase YjgC
MCYYSKLKGSGGKCRTCLVEVAAGSTADPSPMPKLVASCRTNVMDGMIVKNITSERVQMQAMAWWNFYCSITRWIARSVTRPVNVTCRILAMNMAKKVPVTNLPEEHFEERRYWSLYPAAHDPLHSLLSLHVCGRSDHQ